MLIEVFLRSIKYIAEIHNKNMFHGDIKPANILFDISNLKIRISSDSGTLV
jgi:serine/threonine protein kinase